jgi:predicted secreted protein
MATGAACGLGPIGGQKLRRKAKARHAFSIAVAWAVFLTIWFTVLFAVLPFGVRSRHETGDIAAGSDPGAPVAPRLAGKAIWATLISAARRAGRFCRLCWLIFASIDPTHRCGYSNHVP